MKVELKLRVLLPLLLLAAIGGGALVLAFGRGVLTGRTFRTAEQSVGSPSDGSSSADDLSQAIAHLRLSATLAGNPPSAVIEGREVFRGAPVTLTGASAPVTLAEVGDGFVVLRGGGRDFRLEIRSGEDGPGTSRTAAVLEQMKKLELTATVAGVPPRAIINGREYAQGTAVPINKFSTAQLVRVGDSVASLRVGNRDYQIAVRTWLDYLFPSAPVVTAVTVEDTTIRRDRQWEEERQRQSAISDQNLARIRREEEEAKQRWEEAKRRAALPKK